MSQIFAHCRLALGVFNRAELKTLPTELHNTGIKMLASISLKIYKVKVEMLKECVELLYI